MRKLISGMMKWHRKALRLFFLSIFLLGSSACSSMGHILWGQPEMDPPTGNCDPSLVPITNIHWFQDSKNAWRVMGEIVNKSGQVIGSLETGVETRTKFDRPVDQGEDVTANPLNLKPGGKAPFVAWIDRDLPNLDHFEVEVNDCSLADEGQRSLVEINRERVVVDSAGQAEVTAELVNSGTKAVLVNGLMAAVYDRKGIMITAGYAQVTPRQLAPGESSAMRATLALPPGAGTAVASNKFFMDVLAQDAPGALPLNPQQDVKILSHYTDASGNFHLIGQITNSSAEPVMTAVQASIYSAGRSTLLDAGQYATWLPLSPGQSLPFDMIDWGVLNHLPQTLSRAEADANISLRLEPLLSWNTDHPAMELPLVNSNETMDHGTAVFSGQVKNDTEHGISSGLVLAVVKQKSDGQIVAVGNVHLAITDSAAPGAVLDYSLNLPLPPGVSADALQAEVTAWGDQS